MDRILPWLAVICLTVVLDLWVRFALALEFEQVMHAEALLFLGAAGVMVALMIRSGRAPGGRRRLQLVLTGGFALAGVRAALWTAGLPVDAANLAILVVAAVAVAGGMVGRRARHRRRP